MSCTIGVLVFQDAEELDFVGPWEVFGMAAVLGADVRLVSIAERSGPVRCARGLSVVPDVTFADAPPLDVVVVPGGQGVGPAAKNPAIIGWLKEVGAQCQWVTSVCAGTLLLIEAGLAVGKRVTTHWRLIDQLRQRGDVTVLDYPRYVRDGNLVTAAGVSAGIDMALWLTGQLFTHDLARQVQRRIQYEPAPPYAAEV